MNGHVICVFRCEYGRISFLKRCYNAHVYRDCFILKRHFKIKTYQCGCSLKLNGGVWVRCVQGVPLGLLWKTQLLAQVSGWESQKEDAQQQRGGGPSFSWDSRSFIWALRASMNLQSYNQPVIRASSAPWRHLQFLGAFGPDGSLYWTICLSSLVSQRAHKNNWWPSYPSSFG